MSSVAAGVGDRIGGTSSLKGKIAVVTGAGKGAGRTVAEAVAGAGALVYCVDVFSPAAEATAAAIVAGGGTAIDRSVDLSERDEVDALIDDVVRAQGRVDVLCNVTTPTSSGRLLDLSEGAFDRSVHANLKGMLFACQAAARVMAQVGAGSIVNVAVGPFPPRGAAALTEAVVVELSRTLAAELDASGVRVNAIVADIDPAGAPTETAHAVARSAVYLAGDESGPTTGHCVGRGVEVGAET
jgi:3-oxoacyl-[acyl-carrier protein] reductase